MPPKNERFIMSATIEVTCPKCGNQMELDCELFTDPVMCTQCGNEFSLKEDKQSVPPMRRMGPGRAELESVATTPDGNGGFVFLMILIVLIAIALGFVNFWIAAVIGIVGLLAGILVQLGRIANKR
jgi:hypothetical protein